MALEWYNDDPSPWMIQQAKEELENLESEHPNRFKLLKHELETFISDASSAKFHHYVNPTVHNFGSSSKSISTQASTSIRKRKRCPQIQNTHPGDVVQWTTTSDAAITTTKQNLHKMEHQKRTSVDAAIQRAEACLEKLRIVKASFSV
ncbi:hypothetical protein C5167_034628 [Papaver somniferum]|uniref:Uncharacterized protein n=1 Tax=Papaver somniferum TaxID=3469 RepID=A0A4Y7KGF7_PAPSO|nr:uncharacterized protein LOC113293362 [Papaver somniferum]RZC71440.1 hypothetical protein C5167_034628 [Papaver somniferum]